MRASLLCVLISCTVAGAVDVPGTREPINIDGHFMHLHPQDKHLGESVWQEATEITGLPYTKVYALHDENFLYLGFVCGGEEQGEAKGEVRTRDNTAMWQDSCVEIFLEVAGRSYQFILTHVGAVSDLMNADGQFDFDVRAQSLWDTWDWKNWYLEAALPIAEIDPGRQNSVWTFNLCRTVWRDGEMTSVSLVPRGSYKELALGAEYAGGEGLSISLPPMEIAPGTGEATLSIRNAEHEAGPVTIVAETQGPGGTLLREETSVSLQGEAVEAAGFEYSFGEEEGASRCTIRLVDPDGLVLASVTDYYDLRIAAGARTFLDSSTYFGDERVATLTVNLKADDMGASPDSFKLSIRVVEFGRNTPLLELQHECEHEQTAVSLPIDELAPGIYQVMTRILDKATGEVVRRSENRFKKID